METKITKRYMSSENTLLSKHASSCSRGIINQHMALFLVPLVPPIYGNVEATEKQKNNNGMTKSDLF